MTEIGRWIRRHHERFEDGGYPDGIRGAEIPVEGRILAVADSFEAMTSDRLYRPALGLVDSLAELERGAGSQFDPELVTAFEALVRAGAPELGLPADVQRLPL